LADLGDGIVVARRHYHVSAAHSNNLSELVRQIDADVSGRQLARAR
jgi:hypothetical protein